MDCDGVLTDGKLYFSARGEELKVFDIKDGQGIVNWHSAGFYSGIITGRKSDMLKMRAEELGIHFLVQGSIDKVADLESILDELKVSNEEFAYIGDDISDIEILKTAGLAIAVKNSAQEIFPEVHLVTNKNGGDGAVREVIDFLLYSRATQSC